MAFDEKRAWAYGLVTACAYGVYLTIILGRAVGPTRLVDVPYVWALLWTVGGAIVVSIVLHIVVAIVSGGNMRTDERDREIDRFGEYVGQSMVVIGAVGALILAMAEADHFWIANTIYLAFVLSALLSVMAKLAAYRRGLP